MYTCDSTVDKVPTSFSSSYLRCPHVQSSLIIRSIEVSSSWWKLEALVEYRAIGSSLTFAHNEFEQVSEIQLKFYQFVSKFLDVSKGDRPQNVYLSSM